MLITNVVLPLGTILLGVILIIFAAFVLIKNPESRKLAWPWVVGIIGIVVFIGNTISFIVSRVVDEDIVTNVEEWADGFATRVEERADGFAARIEESIAPFQHILDIWSFVLGGILLIIAIVQLIKPENREKTWPWVVGVIGLLMLISNGIYLLLR